ncbi:hypothetical protein M758_3G209900 [Ceratodon purpureus]|nr:hypothetical protein M758_3G209900 [Ceratodon purpureus]
MVDGDLEQSGFFSMFTVCLLLALNDIHKTLLILFRDFVPLLSRQVCSVLVFVNACGAFKLRGKI